MNSLLMLALLSLTPALAQTSEAKKVSEWGDILKEILPMTSTNSFSMEGKTLKGAPCKVRIDYDFIDARMTATYTEVNSGLKISMTAMEDYSHHYYTQFQRDKEYIHLFEREHNPKSPNGKIVPMGLEFGFSDSSLRIKITRNLGVAPMSGVCLQD